MMETSRIYIAGKYNIIFSYIGLTACVFLVIASVVIFVITCMINGGFSLFPVIPLALAFGCYRSARNRVVFIEGKKLFLKGVFDTKTYDIADFKEVVREWWGLGNIFWIGFLDGSSFSFYPIGFGTMFYVPFIGEDPIASEITDLINSMK